jgi:hypothetical protein
MEQGEHLDTELPWDCIRSLLLRSYLSTSYITQGPES